MKFVIVDINGVDILYRVNDDKSYTYIGDQFQDEQYLAWLAEGNTPEEWTPDAN